MFAEYTNVYTPANIERASREFVEGDSSLGRDDKVEQTNLQELRTKSSLASSLLT